MGISRSSSYLPHIDGLRAIALAGVLLFHFKVPPFSGGFAGVDIFLSISGFLITRNILQDTSFSLQKFYIRRFFRLYPAAITTTLFTMFLTYAIFPPDLARQTCASAVASMLFSSNVYFWNTDNYFASSSDLKPLLHTWSLSLEEQFYFLWAPLIVYSKQYITPTLLALTLTSLFLAILLYSNHPSFVFFHLPTRIFQFTLGALTSVYNPSRTLQRLNAVVLDILSVISLVAIFVCFIHLPESASPLLICLICVFSCALLSNPNSRICKFVLAYKGLRWIGRISYSAYLVHWPLYVFYKYLKTAFSSTYTVFDMVLLTSVTMLCGVCLKKGVEDRLRSGKHCLALAFVVFLCSFVATTGLITNGFSFRLSPTESASNRDHVQSMRRLCVDSKASSTYSNGDLGGCHVGQGNGRLSKYVIVGDSFALQMAGGLHKLGIEREEYFKMVFVCGCKLLPKEQGIRLRGKCKRAHEKRWKGLEVIGRQGKERNRRFMAVVANKWDWKNESEQLETMKQMRDSLDKTGFDVMFAVEPPGLAETERSVFACMDVLRSAWGWIGRFIGKKGMDEGDGSVSVVGLCGREGGGMGKGRRLFKSVAGRKKEGRGYRKARDVLGVQVLDLNHELCDRKGEREECRVVGKGWDIGYRRDGVHLTKVGSEVLAQVYGKYLQ